MLWHINTVTRSHKHRSFAGAVRTVLVNTITTGNEMIREIYKTIAMQVPHGVCRIKKESYVNYWGETEYHYAIEYHNRIYKNSPFRCPCTFSTDFTIEQILNSREFQTFISRFN